MTLPDFRQLKDHVEITITSDGLRIELLETEAGVFFESGKAVATEGGSELGGDAWRNNWERRPTTCSSKATRIPNRMPATGRIPTGSCPPTAVKARFGSNSIARRYSFPAAGQSKSYQNSAFARAVCAPASPSSNSTAFNAAAFIFGMTSLAGTKNSETIP